MKPSYNLREQKIYQDYIGLSDSELLKIMDNKRNYRNDIISVVEDILVEKEILHDSAPDSAPDPIQSDMAAFISGRLYEYGKLKETVLSEVQKKYNVNEEEALKALEQVYEKKKIDVLGKFPFKVAFDRSALTITIVMILASLIDVFLVILEFDYTNFIIVRIAVLIIAGIYCGYKAFQLKRNPISWGLFGFFFSFIGILSIALARYRHPKEFRNFIKLIEGKYNSSVKKIINHESVENRKILVEGIKYDMKALYETVLINFYVYQQPPTDSDKQSLITVDSKNYSFRYPNLIIWLAAIMSALLIFIFANSFMIAAFVASLVVLYTVVVKATKVLSINFREIYLRYEALCLVLFGYAAILLVYSWLFNIFYLYGISSFLICLFLLVLVFGYAIITPKYFIGIRPIKIFNDGKLYIFKRIEIVGIVLFFYFLIVAIMLCLFVILRVMAANNYSQYLFRVYFHLPGKVLSYYYIVFFTLTSVVLYAVRKYNLYLRVILTGIFAIILILSTFLGLCHKKVTKLDHQTQKSLIEEQIRDQEILQETNPNN